jgi:hypothetical protein
MPAMLSASLAISEDFRRYNNSKNLPNLEPRSQVLINPLSHLFWIIHVADLTQYHDEIMAFRRDG